MKKFFLYALVAMMATGFEATAAGVTTADENDFDQSIQKPIRSVRQHYATPNEEQGADDNIKEVKLDRNNPKYKPRMTREEYEALEAEKKAQMEAKRLARKNEIDSLLNIDYTKSSIPERKPYTWKNDEVDMSGIDTLRNYFTTANVNGKQRFLYQGITLDIKENDVFLYFTVENGKPELRFRAEFYADDPIEFSRLEFNIDKFKYTYVPKNLNRGKDGTRFFYENFDEPIDDSSKDLAYALSHCRWAVMTFISDRGVNHRIYFKKSHIERFKHVYQMYRMLGGEL